MRFDLQSHSTCSDGALEPAAVVAAAAAAGVELLALTDHDTIGGVAQALRAGEEQGVQMVPAVEISAIDHGLMARELHILGYALDHAGAGLEASLEEFLGDRQRRTLRMASALREVGFELDRAAIDARVAAARPIGRPHLAQAVLACPSNAERLRAEGIDDVSSLIRGYLVEGRPAFRLRETPTVAQAVETIHAAGGIAVWAHPFWDVSDTDEVLATIDRFRALGIDGVEAFYITHNRPQTEALARRCHELGLLSTGSSDFHGPDNELFFRFLAFETYGLQPELGTIAPVVGR